ncbi:hypothetical protein [Nostoc sp. JL31]|uniref:hypothetical protein n=1 Tax=Nostoc sp. JL31 TaxID=2815395 RepID=UPI0025EF9230|nr:hypothetical protein [Nostoc sp. JL31]
MASYNEQTEWREVSKQALAVTKAANEIAFEIVVNRVWATVIRSCLSLVYSLLCYVLTTTNDYNNRSP